MKQKWLFLLGLLGMLLVLSAMPVVWAMPEQQGDEWTVPTRTPTSAPPTDPPVTDPPATNPPATDPPATDPPTSEPSATATRTRTPATSTPTRTPKASRTPTATPDDLTPTVTPTGAPVTKTTEAVTTTLSEASAGGSAFHNVSSTEASRESGEDAQTEDPDEQSGSDPSPTPTGGVRATSSVEDRDQTQGAARTTALVIGGGILFLVGLFVLLAGIRRR